MPEPIVIVTVLSVVAGAIALGLAVLHTWRLEHHRHAVRRDDVR